MSAPPYPMTNKFIAFVYSYFLNTNTHKGYNDL